MNANRNYLSSAFIKLLLLIVPLFGFIISYMIAMSSDAHLFKIGEPTIWLAVFFLLSIIVLITTPRGRIGSNVNNSYVLFVVTILFLSFLQAPFVSVGSRYVYIGFLCYLSCYLSFKEITSFDPTLRGFPVLLWMLFALIIYVFISTRIQSLTGFGEEKVFSTAYIVLYLFPILMVLSNNRMRIIGTLIVLISLFFSNKRGAVVAGSISVISYFIINRLFISPKRNNRIWPIVSVVLGLCAVLIFFNYLIESSDLYIFNRLSSIADDEGSGRKEIWGYVIAGIQDSSPMELLFGHGLESVRAITFGSTAHNDYLEVLYDFGIIAFIIYISFISVLLGHAVKLIKNKSYLAPAFFSSVFLFIIPSLYSHIIIYPQYFLIFSMFWGIEMGLEGAKPFNNCRNPF